MINRAPRRKLRRKFKKIARNFMQHCQALAKKMSPKAELKEYALTSTDTDDFSSTWTFMTMNGLGAGTANNQRLGNKVTLVGFKAQVWYIGNDYYQCGRALLFNRRDGYNVTATDITSGGYWYSHTLETTQAMTIYKDKQLQFGAPGQITEGVSSYPTQCFTMTKYFPKGLEVGFNLTPNIEKNSVEFGMISDSGAANHPQMAYNIRWMYIDP